MPSETSDDARLLDLTRISHYVARRSAWEVRQTSEATGIAGLNVDETPPEQ